MFEYNIYNLLTQYISNGHVRETLKQFSNQLLYHNTRQTYIPFADDALTDQMTKVP